MLDSSGFPEIFVLSVLFGAGKFFCRQSRATGAPRCRGYLLKPNTGALFQLSLSNCTEHVLKDLRRNTVARRCIQGGVLCKGQQTIPRARQANGKS